MAENYAQKRIEQLLDTGSFVELGAYVTARTTDFSLKQQAEPSDGVITGYGQIEGIPVFVYSQNRAVLNGTMGEMHAKKIASLYDKAMATGAPVIGLLDCGGFRLQESVDALESFSAVLAKQMECSGECLMISGVFGACAGGMTLVPALSDFTYMVKDADMFVNAPHTITDNAALAREYDAVTMHNVISGQAEVVDSEEEAIGKIRALVQMLEDEEYGDNDLGDLNRYVEKTNTRALLKQCADGYNFLEVRPAYYPEMVTGFLKLNGILVGAVGNADALYEADGTVKTELPKGLTAYGCDKAYKFIDFCAKKDIPLLTVSAADGFAKVHDTERRLPMALSRMMRAMHEVTAARVNLIIGDTYGSAYVAMGTKPYDNSNAMVTFAWDGVKVGMMPAEKAANILFAEDPEKTEQAAAYEAKQNSVWTAASRGLIDSVIDPKDTRKHLIMAFSML